jgi:CRP-like cAMP-binding protein
MLSLSKRNSFLSSLDLDVLSLLAPHMKNVALPIGMLVAEAGETIGAVYFPISGIISLVVELEGGFMIEAAMTGRDGAANAGAALDGKISPHTALVQAAGEALVIEASRFKALAITCPSLTSAVIAHELLILAQSQQSAACNATHSVEARMCRWLLRMRDLLDGDQLKITQEFLAHMLGVQRGSVSIVASTLQREGIIRYSRGKVRIVDDRKLRHRSCECYEAVKTMYTARYGPGAIVKAPDLNAHDAAPSGEIQQ